MAQAEDTELRDLVIEALERNGSLAKIRALLRANIFLAFEDDCENLKQNVNLDNILKLPEGILALSIVHEFLEFCCLKNTLFVYMSESRQGNEYNYDGKKSLADKLNIPRNDSVREPILMSLIKNSLKLHHKKSFDPNTSNLKNHDNCGDKNYRDDQNCTYILHEDSQSNTTSNSNSDNSSDEKNKLHLRLQLDNSDTDTSSDSARDKSSSEYIPGDHILQTESNNVTNFISQKSNDHGDTRSQINLVTHERPQKDIPVLSNEVKLTTNSSSDSTSYIELKPFNLLDEKMLNTAGLPIIEDTKSSSSVKIQSNMQNDITSPKSGTLASLSPVSLNKESDSKVENGEKASQQSAKSDGESGDFSYGDDFSSSPVSKFKDSAGRHFKPAESIQDDLEKSPNKNSSLESPHQISQSSQSSVSLSDVADLISEKSSLSNTNNKSKQSPGNRSKDKVDVKSSKIYSDDSGDFTESPVPSLSNLSLDIHSD
ncbi:uncharacterized protein LOC142983482 [Anticarsia gemmatalis]|uniref:uncharacterized protein LOC142983482 n=1 Tax=Anticarsia gemmatalis TaxID=129554 RepID=UPI003F75DF78